MVWMAAEDGAKVKCHVRIQRLVVKILSDVVKRRGNAKTQDESVFKGIVQF